MKKLLFSLALALTVSGTSLALDNIVLDNFENGLVNFTTEIHGNPPASMNYTVVDNPVKTGINTSNKVWKWTRNDIAPDNVNWAGFWAVLTNAVPTGYHRVEVKYLRTNATSQLRMKCEGAINKEFDPVKPASKTNEWETIVFDIYANGIKNITVLSLFPDNYTPVDLNSVVYIDDITVVFDATIVPPVIPTLLTLFDNSASDRFHDQSWVNQTAPSTVATENWEAPGMANGDKLPCVTTPVKAGANALKLQWKSATGGDWMALAASVGWKVFDLKTMTHLKLWVNSPVALAKTAMPKIHFEAHSGNPNATGKIDMANYLSANIPANTWTEVTIPLADFWATNPLFLSQGVIKGLFFSQNATDNVLHTMYLDEFTFVKLLSGVDNPTIEKLNAYYANGEVRIANYVGNVRIFDLAGKNVANGKITDGKFRLTIQQGIYIVNTSKGNTKIAVQ